MKSDITELKQDESPKAQDFLKVMLLSMTTSLSGGFIYISAKRYGHARLHTRWTRLVHWRRCFFLFSLPQTLDELFLILPL